MKSNDIDDVEAYVLKVVDTYKNVCIPTISDAYVSRISQNEDAFTITSDWNQKNLELSKNDRFSILHHYDKSNNCLEKVSSPLETNTVLLESISPSLQLRAVMKKHTNESSKKEEFVFEIWSNTLNKRTKTINLTALDKHGDVHCKAKFGKLTWSTDENKILYIAEKKKIKSCGYFETTKSESLQEESKISRGTQFEYEGNWGEQLSNVTNTVIAVLTLSEEQVEVVEGIPEHICPLQPIFGPSNSIIFAALQTQPFRLGFIYCQNRECGIYHLPINRNQSDVTELSKSETKTANFNPQINKRMTEVLFIQSKLSGTGDPHRSSHSLMIYSFTKDETRLLCNQFSYENETMDLYLKDDFGYNCWLPDDVHVVVMNTFRARNYISIVDTCNGQLKSMVECSDMLSIYKGLILASFQKLSFKAFTLMIVDSSDPENPTTAKEEELMEEEIDFGELVDENGLSSFYLIPKLAILVEKRIPLLISPHGGPHSAYTDDRNEFASLMCKLGYAVLLVNFRGSTGFTEKSLRSLPGNIGTQDVNDVHNVAKQFLISHSDLLDNENVFICGGSHGGFLGAHLIGQFPEFYRAACLRNPVIDLSSMSVSTDITDWTYFESGIEYTQGTLPMSNDLSTMLSKSPILHLKKIKAPVLLCIGGKDARVPPSQGMHFFRLLKANKKIAKMLYYPNDNHSLSNVETNGDHVMNICKWFYQHGSFSR